MRTTTALLVTSFLACVASGCGRPCTEGTLLLNVKLPDTSTLPSGTLVTVSAIYLKATFTTSFPLTTEGTVEIDFPSGFAYQANETLELTAVAKAGGVDVAQGTGHYPLSGTCYSDSLILNAIVTGDMTVPADGPAGDLGGADLAASGLAGTDGSIDLATPPDLASPPDLTVVQFSSCAGLAANCGADMGDSCCNSPTVTGVGDLGLFYRSYDTASDNAYTDKTHSATVNDFRLDKYEITVGRFRKFVNATPTGTGTQISPPAVGAGAHAGIAGSGWQMAWNASLMADKPSLVQAVKCQSTYQTWTDSAAGNENRPMNCISWFEAMAFCIWDGGYLPTEAEWNYAAAGGPEQRAYPWSSPPSSLTLDGTYASYYDGTNCVGDGMAGCALTDFIFVGSKPRGDGKWGQSDLAGNVDEWMLDGFGPYVDPCINCANTSAGPGRVIRGGFFSYDPSLLRVASHSYFTPTNRGNNIGARCARTR